jgi:DNA repair exonuclease SbcCD nuclease subunit
MTTRVLFYTDPHVSLIHPVHRVDNYGMAILTKIREAYEIAEQASCEFVICGGDTFNNHRLFSYELLSELMDVICSCSLPTYSVVGQHDVHGYNPATFKSSTLAFVERLCSQLHVMWEPTKLGGVTLYPSHVWQDAEEALRPKDFDSAQVNVLVSHHLLCSHKKVFDTIPTAMYADGPYDVVLSGDLHGGFDPHELNGHWFFNPGALARRAIDEMGRSPKVLIIDLKKGEVPVYDARLLKTARPGQEVFGQEIINIIRENQGEIDPSKFISNIESFEAESTDVHELVQRIGASKGIPKPVLDYLHSKRDAT